MIITKKSIYYLQTIKKQQKQYNLQTEKITTSGQ